MADNFTVLNSAGSTVTFRATDNGSLVLIPMSIPTNKLGTAMIGQAVSATSIPVVIASDQSNVPMNIAQVGGGSLALGQTTMAGSVPVTLASNQSALTVAGTVTATFGGTAAVNLVQIGGSTLAFGQAIMATSIPVAIASNQSVLPMNIASVGAAGFALGQTTMVNSLPVVIASNQSSLPFSLGTVGGVAFTLGQAVMATSLPVAIASNQSVIPVGGDVASGNANSGNPLQLGAVGYTASPTAVANGQRVSLIADKVGKLIAVGALRNLKATQTAALTTTSETTIINPLNATTFADVYGLILANTGATASAVSIRYGLGSAIVMSFEVPAGDTRGFMVPVDSAIPGSLSTANVSWTAQLSATTNLNVSVLYVQNI